MLEEQLERVRAETKEVGEAVGRAKEVVETLGREEQVVRQGVGIDHFREPTRRRSRKEQNVEKQVWRVLERELGR